MARIFADQNLQLCEPVIFKTEGYSMDAGVEVLRWLESFEDSRIPDESWKSAGYGRLPFIGIRVHLDNVIFTVSCDCEELYIERVGGSRAKFFDVCAAIRDRDYEAP